MFIMPQYTIHLVFLMFFWLFISGQNRQSGLQSEGSHKFSVWNCKNSYFCEQDDHES